MYKRKEVIGDCTLYLGDSLEIMPTLEKVDCVVTDPPYLLTSGGEHPTTGQRMSGKFNNENYNNNGCIVECTIDWNDFMDPIFESLNKGHAYIMCNNRHIQNMLNAAEQAGFRFHNMLVWDKHSPTPNRWYMKNCEFTGFFYKGKAKFINDCGSKQLIKIIQRDDSIHPTEKPVELMAHYISNSTKPNDLVLDPFMGSGTTLVACANTGRKGIGIELDQQYFDIACKRVEFAYRQGSLF